MDSNHILNAMGAIDDNAILDAKSYQRPKSHRWLRWGACAACICLVISLSIPTMAAKIPSFYNVLYEISPATAQFFKPVQRSCESQGIQMEVVASYIHEDTAEIYVSLQDLEGDRLSESTDLFDSYSIHTPFDCTSNCTLVSYDPNTKTATFLITIEQWGNADIVGDKLTFSVRELLGQKEEHKGTINDVDLGHITLNTSTQAVSSRGMSGDEYVAENEYADSSTGVVVLKSNGRIASPTGGVALTGIGYIDGKLHVQVYYEDILKTDNHGFIKLINKNTGENIDCYGSVSFFDEEQRGSYTDYVFTNIPLETLGEGALYGEFVTSSGSIEGDWSITFPLHTVDNR